MFVPIDRLDVNYPKLYTKIIDSIKDMIQEGRLKAGDMLPSERDLADLFQVSRVPVREALKILEYIGVVQNVRGKGKYIRSINLNDLIETINFLLLTQEESILELFEMREATELQATRLASIRRTEADLEAMAKAIFEMEEEITSGEDGAKPSLEFHTAILRASKNKILYQVNSYFMDLLEISRKKTLSRTEHRPESLNDHKMIFERIVEQDAEGSAQLMFEHLRRAKDMLAKDFYNQSFNKD